jgi:CheY-like chemotaxis protein
MPERILVVDDNPDTARYAGVMLERQQGCQCPVELVGLPEAERQRLRRHVLLAGNGAFRS